MAKMPLPITFRYHLVENLMRLIKAGESMAVVGIASVGKSNLVRCLQQPDIQEIHLGPEKDEFLIVLIDSNDLVAITEWNFLELLMYRLSVYCQNAKLPTEVVSPLDELHEKLLQRSNEITHAQRCLEQAIHWVCQVNKLRVILLLDEFEILYQELSPRFWVNLRSLRDKNKYSLSYILFMRRDLEDLPAATSEAEAFTELFQTHIFGLKPYDFLGTELMLHRLSLRQQIEWPAHYTTTIFDLSGGHGGLIKVIFGKILPQLKADHSPQFDDLFNDPEVIEECEKIWASLTDGEKVFLQAFVEVGNIEGLLLDSRAIVDKLSRKGLINFEPQEPRLFSTLFAGVIRRKMTKGSSKAQFYFDTHQQSCWIDGQEINLPWLPAQLLEFLYKNRGNNCRRIDLLRHLYPDEDHNQFGKVPDFRLDSVVKNLRERIEPDPQNPRYVKTVRGVGFKLDID